MLRLAYLIHEFFLKNDLVLVGLVSLKIIDIRQSIDRNDFGENPSFWKLEILVYFLVYFKNWNL